MTEFDVQRARRETPGCADHIHLNNAGASLMPAPVLEACRRYLELEAIHGGYEAAARVSLRIEQLYDQAARLIGAEREEIAVVDSGTRAWHSAMYGIKLRPGDRILTSDVEYASNYIAMLHVAERTGATLEVIPSEDDGQVSVEALQDMLAIYLLDAVQSVGQIPIDVASIGCDILAATGRKYLRGPRGTGFLYVRRGLLEELTPPILDLQSATWINPSTYEVRKDARRFELWEKNYAALMGLGAAVEYAQSWGLDRIRTRVVSLAELNEGAARRSSRRAGS
jgi:cysteine desulfurase/selenocysteine lyase